MVEMMVQSSVEKMVEQRDFAMAVLKVDLMVILIVLKMVDALTILMVI